MFRMRSPSVLLCAVVLGIVAHDSASYCPRPSDPTSALYDLNRQLPRFMSRELQQVPDTWLRCLGSINLDALSGALIATALAQPSCLATLAIAENWFRDISPMMSRTMPSTVGAWPAVTNSDVENLCQPMINVVLPCLANGIFPQVMNQVRANPCCADALTNGTAVLGISPDLFVLKVLNYTTDVVCATQTPGYDGTTNQTCGYAWFKSFTATDPVGNSSQIVERLISSVQVPNDQGCAAVKGDPFVATTGAFIAQLFGKPFVPDACVNPVDNLLRYVRLIPGLVSVSWEGFRPLDALEKGKCAREASMPGICVHLANGEYGSCPFASSWKSAVFPGEGTKLVVASSTSNDMAPMTALAIAVAITRPW
ncbi:hypothetical protein H310_05076 [Aphanomyces invadans]|uniref:Uncharacterized protein n=1 Tax=Aphanomyces invadans TaxID=157072 RepID=A0A024UBV7_9STRA|nr:hypothetical protein H310_05076 [Aphanomyces invadans]ETW03690.1 hypothetical protein H310_05076 [Aphanomyces invadans]|eukprot:XP_008867919.1 hypothetical protein H310_05076 [Aphanomyces invadans]